MKNENLLILEEIRDLIQRQNIYKKEILTLDEAVEYIRVSKSFLYKLTSKGKISHSKPSGKLVFFKRADLDKWMLSNKSETVNELESQVNNYLKRGDNDE